MFGSLLHFILFTCAVILARAKEVKEQDTFFRQSYAIRRWLTRFCDIGNGEVGVCSLNVMDEMSMLLMYQWQISKALCIVVAFSMEELSISKVFLLEYI